ncbi:transcription-repair coupling factor [Halothiobacillus diazotrophicus]|uniref:Transcription-repair-coupling factor n=1 Tax=Halothiobacillus diazotrophicus TaxID=1860122 RepID=A0A191ZH58_9GAMM|nr:transcription-repair coupling factor [Halothiobacillus diazotrophicus]ANJ67187.1 transcription-repair coupling factor [Halothiobacillus diazotrophicus]
MAPSKPPRIAIPKSPADPLFLRSESTLGTAYTLANLAQTSAHPLLVIAPDSRTANEMAEALALFDFTSNIFPDWEVLPYDRFSPHQDLISDRLARLWHLPRESRGITLIAAPTLLQRLPPPSFVTGHSFLLKAGDRLDREAYRQQLIDAGYLAVSQVAQPGEFALRGGLIDVFPTGMTQPVRIDLFDDEIETLRLFDPETQRSTDPVPEITLLPAREYPLNETGIATFRRNWRNRFEGDPTRSPVYKQISDGLVPAGIETYLPLFFDDTVTLFDYLPKQAALFVLPGVDRAIERFTTETIERYTQRAGDVSHPILKPDELYQTADQYEARLKQWPRLLTFPVDHPGYPQAIRLPHQSLPELANPMRGQESLAGLQAFSQTFPGRILLTAESPGRREAFGEQLIKAGIRAPVFERLTDWLSGGDRFGLLVTPIERGAILALPDTDAPLALITETDLFAERVAQRRRSSVRTRDADALINNLNELAEGAPVVHEEHGVGRFGGLTTLAMNGLEQEFLILVFAGDDRLYVPVSSLHLISRYTGGSEETAPLHKLGSGQWEKAKRRAAEQVRDVAAELLDVHARRAAKKGHALPTPAEEYAEFANAFPFETTADQQLAIDSVLADMARAQPMDRVVCGDVGFGKTEVAMRAAFIAVQNGRQVAVLVPTTLLAEQHLRNFRDRFAGWPLRIEGLSRLHTGKKAEQTLTDIAEGKVDIVIGTHKLLRDKIEFHNLGLVIIDEEQRFGVRDKEQLKRLRAEVDLLTLTATPIPRTLNMALSGIRDLSIIATPPRERLAVKTLTLQWDDAQIREAVQRELKRGGQVYFLHNEVKTIDRMAKQLAELIPEVRIAVAHGQMPERGLEQIMADFYHQRYNLLLSTTIIESGIDIHTANTIIINRADKFGLAQLHQLRGRVGRSHHRAYAYLITPEPAQMTADAVKRLDALTALEELGVGFTLATHDLEIRGAGELLGEGQSGQMHEVGYGLYMDLLDRAVRALKSGKEPNLLAPLEHVNGEVDLGLPALIPADYVPDVHNRLILYKRLANCTEQNEIDQIKVELIDRFGLLPDPTQTLIETHRLRLRARDLGMRKLELASGGGRIVFTEHAAIDPVKLVKLVQSDPQKFRLTADTLKWTETMDDLAARTRFIERLLGSIAP